MKSSILLNDTRIDHHHGCERVVAAIEHLAEKYGFPVKHHFVSHTIVCGTERYENALKECDVLLVNGEGTLHHDRPAGLELLKAAAQAKKEGKYVVLLNAGWEGNSDLFGEFLSEFDLIVARDKASQLAISSFNVACERVPDLSVYLPMPRLPTRLGPERIAFTDSVLRDLTLELFRSAEVLGGDMLSIQFPIGNGLRFKYKFIREALSRHDLKCPRFLMRLIHCRLKQLNVSDCKTDNWLENLATYSLLVSGRFHACTLAILTGVPFVALQSNTAKIHNLINDCNLNLNRLIEIVDLPYLQAADWSYSDSEKHNIDNYLTQGRAQTDSLFQKIKCDLNL